MVDNQISIDSSTPSAVAPTIISSRDIREEVILNFDDGNIVISTDVSPVYSYVLYVNKTHLNGKS